MELSSKKRKFEDCRDDLSTKIDNLNWNIGVDTIAEKQRKIEEASEAFEIAAKDLRLCHAMDAWETAKTVVGEGDTQACATFAAGIVNANSLERAMSEAAKLIATALNKAVED